MSDWPRKHGPAWFYWDGDKFPAVITRVHTTHDVDVAYVWGGSVYDHADLPIIEVGEPPTGRYVKQPAPDDNVDVDAILAAREQQRRLPHGDDANDAPTSDTPEDPT